MSTKSYMEWYTAIYKSISHETNDRETGEASPHEKLITFPFKYNLEHHNLMTK